MTDLKHPLMALALGLALATGSVPAAVAQADPSPLTLVLQRLEAEGYQVVETHRSWLGRIVVLSTRDGQLRELVLNRTTGSVLSDRLFAQPDAPRSPGAPDASGDGSGGGPPSSGGSADPDRDKGSKQHSGNMAGRT